MRNILFNRKSQNLRNIFVCLTGLLFLSSCSTIKGELDESGYVDTELNVGVDNFSEHARLFTFTAPELFSGLGVKGKELYANSPTIMSFVVPSCTFCAVEGPKLAEAARDNPDINYVVVHSFGNRESYFQYVKQSELDAENIVHIVDNTGDLWRQFNIVTQPSSVLVAADGGVSTSAGALGDDGLQRAADLVVS